MTETENILTRDSRDASGDGAPSGRIGDQAQVSRELFANMAGLRLKLARVTRNPDLAADILQDAIVTALQKLNAGELSARTALDGFVYRVALNHLRNHQRKDKSPLSDQNAAAELPDPRTHCMTETLQSAQWARVTRELLMEVKPVRDRELLGGSICTRSPRRNSARCSDSRICTSTASSFERVSDSGSC